MPCPVPGGIWSDDLWAGAAQRGLSCVQAVELQRCSRGACCALARHVAYVPTVWTQYLHVSSGASPACVQCARNGLALLGWKPLSSWESPVPEAAGEWFQLWEHQWACVNWFLCDSWLIPHPIAQSSWLVSCLASGLHFGTSGTALPISTTVCGRMMMLERNRIPVLCSSLKRCCKCRTFVSAALNIWVVTFK